MTELSNRAELARAITLIESKRTEDYDAKYALVRHARQSDNTSIRIAITGAPGVGKSSLIEKIGLAFIEKGHRVAVLAVDPSSPSSGGSILGDKTRMELLAASPAAFIRPTPSASQTGGVSEFTRETVSLCEAAGYDVVLIETVGVGQGEYAVQGMSDMVVLVTIPGTGDGLQGIKRGIMEMADLILINKCDGVNETGGAATLSQIRNALRISRSEAALPDVVCTSVKSGVGLEQAVEAMVTIAQNDVESGAIEERRKKQEMTWFSDAVASRLKSVPLDKMY